MQSGADGAAACRAVGIAAEEARLDARAQISGVVDRHPRERAVLRILRWIREGAERAVRKDQRRVTLLQPGSCSITSWRDCGVSRSALFSPRWACTGSTKSARFGTRCPERQVAAAAQALRLDTREAPQRELARQQKKKEDGRAAQEKAREANKALCLP